jgi:Cu+-exporting ATPase
VRNAEALEGLAGVDTLVVDKTGTLTEGRPELVDVATVGPWGKDELLQLAASLEQGSEHPLSVAIVSGARRKGLGLSQAEAFDAITGSGISGRVKGREILIGTAGLLSERGIDTAGLAGAADQLSRNGASVVLVAIDAEAAGAISLADTIKAEAAKALSDLSALGIDVVMATGDGRAAAQAVARTLGISTVHAGVSPSQKSRIVSDLKAHGRKVAFAGDGVNDAPALAAADVGIAMGTGADVAIESAGLTLPKGDLRAIVRAARLAKATTANIRQNLALAFGYNALAIPLAAGVLYPLLGVLLSPMVAALAMSLSSVSVIANALRLGRS